MRLFIKKLSNTFENIGNSQKYLFGIGFFIMFVFTVVMIVNNRYNVFFVYKYGTLDFWNNINPYSNWEHPYDRYLYGPVFSIFFYVYATIPSWLGGLLWNISCFILFFSSVFYLPKSNYNFRNKRFIYLFLLPIVLTDLFYFQCNVFVASILIFAFSFLEKKKQFYAIVLILFSGFSKIYGFIQLGILLFYKKFWKNIFFTIIFSLIFFIIPILKIPFSELIDYYQSWFDAISQRHNPVNFETIYKLLFFIGFKSVANYIEFIQLISLLAICTFTLLNHKKFNQFSFRVEVFGIIISWVILFSTTAEKHTYIIAMTGLIFWYLSKRRTKLDKVLLWLNFLIIILVPIDVLFPKPVMRLLYNKLYLNLILFFFTWLRMFYLTYIKNCNFFSKDKALKSL